MADAVRGTDGWLTDAEGMLLSELARNVGHGTIVEIGSWKGRSTTWLALGSAQGSRCTVIAIDPHTGSEEHRADGVDSATFGEFTANVERNGVAALVQPLLTTSSEAARDFDRPIGLLFVDGAHDYASVSTDIANWRPKLQPGAAVAFHDMSASWPETWRAVRDHMVRAGVLDRVRFVHMIVYGNVRTSASRRAALAGLTVLAYKRAYDGLRPAIGLAGRLARARRG